MLRVFSIFYFFNNSKRKIEERLIDVIDNSGDAKEDKYSNSYEENAPDIITNSGEDHQNCYKGDYYNNLYCKEYITDSCPSHTCSHGRSEYGWSTELSSTSTTRTRLENELNENRSSLFKNFHLCLCNFDYFSCNSLSRTPSRFPSLIPLVKCRNYCVKIFLGYTIINVTFQISALHLQHFEADLVSTIAFCVAITIALDGIFYPHIDHSF